MNNPLEKPLRNAKHERFALLVFQRVALSRAYIAAGYRARGHAAETNASRLLKNAEIQARLEGLKRESASEAVSSILERKERLTRIARGEAVEPATFEGTTIFIPAAVRDQIKAIEVLGKMEGDFTDSGRENRPNITVNMPARAMTEAELLAVRQRLGTT